jgi:hypothetical protein
MLGYYASWDGKKLQKSNFYEMKQFLITYKNKDLANSRL